MAQYSAAALNPSFGDQGSEECLIGNMKAYVTGSPSSKKAVILVSDVYGKVVAELGKTDAIQAAVMFHPSLVTLDDIKEAQVPTAILGAEADHSSPPELMKKFEEVLSAKREMNSSVKIFSGVGHSWTMKYDIDDEAVMKKA